MYIVYSNSSGYSYPPSCNYTITKTQTPTFTLSSSSTTVDCNSTTPITFTVNNVYDSPGSKSYNWDIGSGWVPSGVLTTTTNVLTLTPTAWPPTGSVKVTPVLDGVSYPQLTKSITLSDFTSNAVITSSTNQICSTGTVTTFNISGVLAGQNVTWSSSNSQIATISNPTNSQVTVTAQSQGIFYVFATIKNSCGQTVPPKTSQPITIGAPMPLIDGFTCVSESAPCNLDIEANNNYLTFSLSAPSGTYVPQDSDWQWEKVSGNFYFLDNGQYNSSTHTGRQGNIYLTGANPTDNPLQFRCRFKNTCGWGQWRNYVWNDGTTTPVTPPPSPAKYYIVTLSGSYSANISLLDPAIAPTTTSLITARLYTTSGQELSSTQLYNNSGVIYIYSYPYNTIMYIVITFDNHSETHTIIKYSY